MRRVRSGGAVASRGRNAAPLRATASRAARVENERFASTATTDARFFQLYGGIPATCYGPQAGNTHGIDEWVSIASMMEVTQVLALFMARWCGLNAR